MSKEKRKEWIKRIGLSILVLLCMIRMICLIGPENVIHGDEISEKYDTLPSFITYELNQDTVLTQTFTPRYGYVSNMKLVMLQVGDERPGSVVFQILDNKKQVVFEEERFIADIPVGEWFTLETECCVPAHKECSLQISVKDSLAPVSVMLVNRDLDIDENNVLLVNDVEQAGGLLVTFDYLVTFSVIGRSILCLLVLAIGALLLIAINVPHIFSKHQKIFWNEGDITKISFYCGIGLVLLIMYYVHIYKLYQVPYGIHIDAMGMGYDAWSIANFGIDRHMKSYPVYLVNYGGGQSALYMYMVAFLIKIFGYSEKLFRVPALINALLIFIFGSMIVNMKWKKRIHVLTYMILFNVFPIFAMLTRVGLDCNLMLGFSTMFLWCLLYAIEKGKLRYYFLAGGIGGITLYTYAISYLVLPLFLCITLLYLIWIGKINLRQVIALAIPLAFLAFPLIMVQIINLFQLPEMKIGMITLTKLPFYRSEELSLKNFLPNIYHTLVCIFWNDMWNYDSLPEFKTMYWFTIPFAVIGIINTICQFRNRYKDKTYDVKMIVLIWLVAMVIVGGMIDGGTGPTCYKVNGSYFVVGFFIVEGLTCLYYRFKSDIWIKECTLLLAIAYTVSFVEFTEFYYGLYTQYTYPSVFFSTTFEDTIQEYNTLPEDIRAKAVCVQMSRETDVVYFAMSLRIAPNEFERVDNEYQYKNYNLCLTQSPTIDTNQVYFIQETNKDFAVELEKNGFLVKRIGTRFLCYCG